MASVKVKFRPSTVNGREGTLYYQVIHNRVVRQINTEYKLFVSEWDCHSETVVLYHLSVEQERNNYLLSIGSRIKWDKDRLNKIIHALSQSGTFVAGYIEYKNKTQEKCNYCTIYQCISGFYKKNVELHLLLILAIDSVIYSFYVTILLCKKAPVFD